MTKHTTCCDTLPNGCRQGRDCPVRNGVAEPASAPSVDRNSAPQQFIDYVAANYNGVVDIHRPEWHAVRLWRAAMSAAVSASLAAPQVDAVQAVPEDELPMALDQLSAIVDALINKCADLRRIGNARKVKATMPEGWIALSIVFDGDHDYPEEVAYGPPDMMARLGKRLDKYYADVIAKRDAAQPTNTTAGE